MVLKRLQSKGVCYFYHSSVGLSFAIGVYTLADFTDCKLVDSSVNLQGSDHC